MSEYRYVWFMNEIRVQGPQGESFPQISGLPPFERFKEWLAAGNVAEGPPVRINNPRPFFVGGDPERDGDAVTLGYLNRRLNELKQGRK
jgi:hypothetical protein